MITVTLFHRSDCQSCGLIEANLRELQPSIPHNLVKVDVDSDPDLWKKYWAEVPMLQIGPYRLTEPFTRQDILAALGAARDRQQYLQRADEGYQARWERGHTISKTDRFSHWLSRHYMILFNLLLFIYVGLPFLAPTLMQANIQWPARVIYTIYSPFCHQFAFRSWFLFGKQTFYPLELAQMDNLATYEEVRSIDEVNLAEARRFIGDERVGYKIALCQRDIAIYGGILLFGLVFMFSGRRLGSVPWYVWLLLGVGPIGLDGTSQLPGLMGINLPVWLPIRESNPLLRTATGAMFGIMTAWYIYPIIESVMQETRAMLARKIAVVKQTPPDVKQ